MVSNQGRYSTVLFRFDFDISAIMEPQSFLCAPSKIIGILPCENVFYEGFFAQSLI